jgi:hypothetical protein
MVLLMGGFAKYAVEMASGSMIITVTFTKISSDFQVIL